MRVLCFDTETTGLPIRKENGEKEYPYIVQISWMIYDTKERDISTRYDTIISIPKEVEIPEVCIRIHGITKKKSDRYGIPIEMALEHFIDDLKTVDRVIAHNISFDRSMIGAECKRHNIEEPFQYIPLHKQECTMKSNIIFCNLPKRKYPKLIELHEKLFPSDHLLLNHNVLHDSFADVMITLRCYLYQRLQIDIREQVEYIIYNTR
jgi:DNA polymerase III epsilon subunit-like protein